MKRIISVVLVIIMLSALPVTALAQRGGMQNFRSSERYSAGRFGDVCETEWFAKYVRHAYNYDLMRGRSDDEFAPHDMLTYGEAIALAVRLRSTYFTSSAQLEATESGFEAYEQYALYHNMLDDATGDYSAPATRAQFARLIHGALPIYTRPEINSIPDGSIVDVSTTYSFADATYGLYRAGILRGCADFGSFRPNSQITRAEAAAVMTRVVVPTSRVEFELPEKLPIEDMLARSASAVFMLEMFDNYGETIRTGSGFFITNEGHAVTNLHVLDHAIHAIITLADGRTFPVRGLHASCIETNLAIISIDTEIDEVWNYITLAESSLVETGESVFVISSPQGMMNSITSGVVSSAMRDMSAHEYIQFTAAISFGSGGGPLLNERGQAIGVASSSLSSGQNINFAVPSKLIRELEIEDYTVLKDIVSASPGYRLIYD